MCIFLERWYTCPHDAESEPLADEHANPPAPEDPAKPWESWHHGDRIPHVDLVVGSLALSGPWVMVRHHVGSVIRCASFSTRNCDITRTTRTELYDAACPGCTGQDGFTRPGPPNMTIYSRHDMNGMNSDQISAVQHAAFDYFEDTERMVHWLVSTLFENLTLPSGARTLWSSSWCTEDMEHAGLTGLPLPSTCRCPNNEKPWAHNIARAMIRKEAIGAFANSSEASIQELAMELHNDEVWGHYVGDNKHLDLKEQAWIGLDAGGHGARYNMEARVENEARKFYLLGEEKARSELGDDETMIEEALLRWNREVRVRKWLALQWTYYAGIDPGLSPLFRKIYLDQYVLPLLSYCPGTDLPRYGYGEGHNLKLYYDLNNILAPLWIQWPEKESQILDAQRRRETLYQDLCHNRDLVHKNAIAACYSMESYLRGALTTSATAASISDRCLVCQEDIHVYEDDSLVPLFRRIVLTPCCQRPIHWACILPILRQNAYTANRSCPNCRSEFSEHGWEDPSHWDLQPYKKPLSGFVDFNRQHFQATWANMTRVAQGVARQVWQLRHPDHNHADPDGEGDYENDEDLDDDISVLSLDEDDLEINESLYDKDEEMAEVDDA